MTELDFDFDFLDRQWRNAEQVLDDNSNQPRPGDLVIVKRSPRNYSVFTAPDTWGKDNFTIGSRILKRAPRRPNGAEELEALLEKTPKHLRGQKRIDWLIEHGVRVVSDDEDMDDEASRPTVVISRARK